MANLWQVNGGTWERWPLLGNYAVLGTEPDRPLLAAGTLPAERGPAVLTRQVSGDSLPAWALLSPPESRLWVNGHLLSCGLCVLHDRDEILIAGRSRFYFSTEELAKGGAISGGRWAGVLREVPTTHPTRIACGEVPGVRTLVRTVRGQAVLELRTNLSLV